MLKNLLRFTLFCSVLSCFTAVSHAEDPDELIFVFQKQKDPSKIEQAADKVADFLSSELDRKVSVKVPANYSASVQALVSKKADFAYTSSMPFLLARRDGDASMILAEVRKDASGEARTDYDAVFVVRKDSPLKTIEDLVSNSKNLRFAFTSPTSTSGHIFAIYRFVKEGLIKPGQNPKEVFRNISFAGSYTQALEQVVQGRADVCAVSYYTVEGAKAEKYLDPKKREQVRILARTPGVPTHLISGRGGLSSELKNKVKIALLKLSRDMPDLLSDVYGTATFIDIDENQHVQKTVDAVQYVGLPVENLVK